MMDKVKQQIEHELLKYNGSYILIWDYERNGLFVTFDHHLLSKSIHVFISKDVLYQGTHNVDELDGAANHFLNYIVMTVHKNIMEILHELVELKPKPQEGGS